MIMKKLIVAIVILATIFVGMIIYKKVVISANNDISIQEVEKIETYITKIYMWREITEEALPTFENINEANEAWIWEVVKKNLEEYELSYSQIEEKAKELFGSDFTKKFPEKGSEYLTYDEQTNKYYAVGRGLDEEEDSFLLDKIEKTKNGYEVEIIEYLEDYSDFMYGVENFENTNEILNENPEISNNEIVIRNLNDDEIGKVEDTEEERAKEIVKNNVEKFSKKKLTIKKEEEQLYIQKVE